MREFYKALWVCSPAHFPRCSLYWATSSCGIDNSFQRLHVEGSWWQRLMGGRNLLDIPLSMLYHQHSAKCSLWYFTVDTFYPQVLLLYISCNIIHGVWCMFFSRMLTKQFSWKWDVSNVILVYHTLCVHCLMWHFWLVGIYIRTVPSFSSMTGILESFCVFFFIPSYNSSHSNCQIHDSVFAITPIADIFVFRMCLRRYRLRLCEAKGCRNAARPATLIWSQDEISLYKGKPFPSSLDHTVFPW